MRMEDNCKTPFIRESCILCALKHLSQARVLILEARKGYPAHAWFAMGHMAEAEDELLKEHKEMSDIVRTARIGYQTDQANEPDFWNLVNTLIEYDNKLADDILEKLNG